MSAPQFAPNSGEDQPLSALTLTAFTALAGFVACFLFAAFPQLDLFVSGLFYRAGKGFVFGEDGSAETVRTLLDSLFWAICALALLGLAFYAVFRKRLLGKGLPQWVCLVALLVVGPGLVANAVLKDHWGRARPNDIVEFGGAKTFTPVLVRSDQCSRNCSFVAGEVSSIFAAFAGLALISHRRRALLVTATSTAALAAFIRIGQGAHFLSDAIFAVILMMLTALTVHALVFRVWPYLTKSWRLATLRRIAPATPERTVRE